MTILTGLKASCGHYFLNPVAGCRREKTINTTQGQANHMTPEFSASFLPPVPLSRVAAHFAVSGAPLIMAAAVMIFALSLWIASRSRV